MCVTRSLCYFSESIAFWKYTLINLEWSGHACTVPRLQVIFFTFQRHWQDWNFNFSVWLYFRVWIFFFFTLFLSVFVGSKGIEVEVRSTLMKVKPKFRFSCLIFFLLHCFCLQDSYFKGLKNGKYKIVWASTCMSSTCISWLWIWSPLV